MNNPITEIKADTTTAQALHNELQYTLNKKRQAVRNFYEKRALAEKENAPKPIIAPPPAKPKFNIIADKDKEAELLKMAKARYQSYADVALFAKELNLRAGVVYLTLKHHGFIRQTETTQYRVLDSYYRNNGNLKVMTEETGLTVWICAKTIEQLGLSPNWAGYKSSLLSGCKSQGRSGEEEFARLVPEALDMNAEYKFSNEAFDFILNEKKIDVKTYNSFNNRGTKSYVLRLNHGEQPDFYCVFLIIDKEKGCVAGNYHILLIPSVIIPDGKTSVHISPTKDSNRGSAFYWDFEVEPAALATILENL